MGIIQHSDAPSTAILPKVMGAASAACVEIGIFHPVDTVAKRLMSNTDNTRPIREVIFRNAVDLPALGKARSLFPGLQFAVYYKGFQRIYKFGGQPLVYAALDRSVRDQYESMFGPKHARTMMQASAGCLMGIGEVALLPLDVLKIKAQTNPEAIGQRGLVSILKQEKLADLYRGASWTVARNAPGSFALFGANAWAKDTIFEGNMDAYWKTLVTSTVGSLSSILVASPLDVIKTRIQNRDFSDRRSGMAIVKELMAKEGPGAFFKGITPKAMTVAPKLIFSFSIAQYITQKCEDAFK
mmetsp:Transcript_236/g.319  ORF Transcript_236/g.319 Transcript_236/m.319 type:complete len:298 (-) Transcript_236:65-958(-)|eukprot:CAMPEP_0196570726 /NCGR_PEP_ID=MMETSP1081-20130531/888_1 /TAXON_ID=36882 /ORGANISM="Pyramimonas amylifera, Strain CCMP720" /LENGTH=297 /DNA_ID=CAMNT_0041887335 /DNA_START=31 /DNA_END=924 /DNA_ORIENTATION=-